MGYKIDESAKGVNYALGVCDCGARFPAFSREAALRRLALHESNAHPDQKSARANKRKYKNRKK